MLEFSKKCACVFVLGYEIRGQTYIVSQKEIIFLFLEIRSQTKVEDEVETPAGDESDAASELSLTLK